MDRQDQVSEVEALAWIALGWVLLGLVCAWELRTSKEVSMPETTESAVPESTYRERYSESLEELDRSCRTTARLWGRLREAEARIAELEGKLSAATDVSSGFTPLEGALLERLLGESWRSLTGDVTGDACSEVSRLQAVARSRVRLVSELAGMLGIDIDGEALDLVQQEREIQVQVNDLLSAEDGLTRYVHLLQALGVEVKGEPDATEKRGLEEVERLRHSTDLLRSLLRGLGIAIEGKWDDATKRALDEIARLQGKREAFDGSDAIKLLEELGDDDPLCRMGTAWGVEEIRRLHRLEAIDRSEP